VDQRRRYVLMKPARQLSALKRARAIAVLIASVVATAGLARADTIPSTASTTAATGIAIWPTMTPAGDDPGGLPLHKPAESETRTSARAQELDATLRDGAQDLGFILEVGERGPAVGRTRDSDMLDAAGRGAWVVSPRIEHGVGDSFIVRMVVVPPNGRELRVRVETIKGADVSVRGLVMLRDLLSPTTAAQAAAIEKERAKIDPSASLGIISPTHSPGRAVLAVNGAHSSRTAFSARAGTTIRACSIRSSRSAPASESAARC
jgi:hypothetical protein